MKKRWIRGLVCGTSCVALAGCAGARSSMRFDHLEYPVSMSPYLVDGAGESRSPRELEVVGKVRYEETAWGMVYSAVRLTGEHDVSQPINQQVRAAGGDGVVGLTVVSDYCTLNYVPILPVLPFWPGCTDVSVTGKVVRIKPSAAPTSPAPTMRKTVATSSAGPGEAR
ncbi:MAG: hypothetical protein JW940_36350 [Polyangiaceae bacterium]|nr:hypothetical protein [Polyangiaceae bacterium]